MSAAGSGPVSARRLAMAALAAAMLAAAANVGAYRIAEARFGVTFEVPLAGPGMAPEPISIPQVVLASAAPAPLGAALMALIAFFLPRPRTLFALTAALVVLFSMAGPFVLPDIPWTTRLALATLHVIAGIIEVPIIAWAGGPSTSAAAV